MSARSLNKVMLIGNLTRDPELRYTPSGTAVCSFSLATNRSWTPSDGSERREETEFHRIVAWNKRQSQRQKILKKFKQDEIKILLATDVASRGLDIDNVSHVINYDLPETYDHYVHRIGRTGRANKAGKALTFVD